MDYRTEFNFLKGFESVLRELKAEHKEEMELLKKTTAEKIELLKKQIADSEKQRLEDNKNLRKQLFWAKATFLATLIGITLASIM